MSASSLRALIDVTALSGGLGRGVGRAGIFRAAQGFIAELITRRDVGVDLAALHSYVADLQFQEYARHNARLSLAGQRRAWHHRAMSDATALDWIGRAAAADPDSDEGRRAMATLTLANRLAAPQSLGRYDVYHSLRHELADPSRVDAPVRTLLVHDLIPFQFPDLAGAGFADALAAILRTVNVTREGIICNSQATRTEICRYLGIDGRRVFVAPLAADPAIFHPVSDPERLAAVRRRLGIGDRPYILSVATIEPRKNLASLIRAFRTLVAAGEDARDLQLVLAGATGWKSEETFRALADAHGLTGRIVVTGYVADDDLAPLYSAADVFAYPSWYEGFGLPVLEAMQCGTPVVTTDRGGLGEFAPGAALIVRPDQVNEIADGLRAARCDRTLRAAGRTRAAAYSWGRTVDLTIDAWQAMLR